MQHEQSLRFFITKPHTCSYLVGRQASNAVADPALTKTQPLYSALAANGFRRNGEFIYKPHCRQCNECIAVRLPVQDFVLSRSQKRVLKKNNDLSVQVSSTDFQPKHFALYQQYLSARHEDGGMDNPTIEQYQQFLWSPWSTTKLIEFKLADQLMMVAVIDELDQALSAVYTFFKPNEPKRSLGKFAILWLAQKAQTDSLSWLYLGYWIADCGKMNYKSQYQPLEYFIDGQWTQSTRLKS